VLLGGICGVCYDIAVLVGKVMDSSELVEIKCIDGRDCSELDVHGSKRKNFEILEPTEGKPRRSRNKMMVYGKQILRFAWGVVVNDIHLDPFEIDMYH
jgi:hypothetical protein